jgi:hypothetical protein
VLHYLVRVLCAGDYNVRGRCQSLAYDRVCHRVQQRRTLARNGRDERHEWNEEGGEEGRARRRSEENAGGSSSYQPLTQLYCYHPRCASLSLSVEAVETSVGSSRGFLFIAFTTQDYLLL